MSSDFLKGVLDAVVNLVEGLGKLIDTVGVLPTLIGGFAAFKSIVGGKGFFKVIEDQAALTGKRIGTLFSDAAKDATSAFSTIGLKTNSSFKNSLKSDITALGNYSYAMKTGSAEADAFNQHMKNAGEAARAYAQSGKIASDGIEGFIQQQKAAGVATIAQNKSLTNVKSIMQEYAGGCKNVGMSQKAFAEAVATTNSTLGKSLVAGKGVNGMMTGYIKSVVGAKAATIALSAASMALNAALTMGIGLAISAVVSLIDKAIETSSELAERVDEVTSKYKEQHKALTDVKGDFDKDNSASAANRYAELSKGVDDLGRNVSLTTAEYEEYKNVVNQIASQVPSLVAGYDAHGNAILNTKGSVEDLTAAYQDLIKSQNNDILTQSGDIEKDFQNVLNDKKESNWNSSELTSGATSFLDKALKEQKSAEEIAQGLSAVTDGGDVLKNQIKTALEDADLADFGLIATSTEIGEALEKANKENPDLVKGIIDGFNADIEAETEGMKSIAEAVLSNAFDVGDTEYSKMSEKMQNLARQTVSSFDAETYKNILGSGKSVSQYVTGILEEFKRLDAAGDSKKLEAVFDLQTQFNSGDISYGKYVNGLRDAEKLIDGLNVDEEVKKQIKLALNIDEVTDEYDALKSRLTSEEYNIKLSADDAKAFLNDMTAEDLTVAMDVVADFKPLSNEEIERQFDIYEKGGNVDLAVRPKVDASVLKDAGWKDAGEAAATVFTSTFSNEAGDVAMNFTPIMMKDNGDYDVLSPEKLQKYAEEVISGTREDDLNLKIGATFEGDEAIEDAERSAKYVHHLQDFYYNGTEAQLQSAIDRAKALQGLTLDLSINVESKGIENLNTALQESVSATGLSGESINNLKSRYAELENKGYDLSAMFEETSNGIHLNKTALSELEQAYGQQKQEEVESGLNALKDEYDYLTESINNCTDAGELVSLYSQRDAIAQKINDTATLASQYDGLTSAYKAWQDAEAAGNERDMYENVIGGLKTMGDEISRGWMDDGSIKLLELLTGQTDLATKSAKELKDTYDGLDKKINSAGYSVRDFFTVDADGNSTSDGVYNFLDTVDAEFDKAVKRDENGNIISFDFGIAGGDEAVAEALGISEELVQIMVRAADDAGFVINLEGAYTQLTELKTAAESAGDALREMQAKGDLDEKLKLDFKFDASSVEDLEKEIDKADKVLDKFKNKDGTIKTDKNGNMVKGAKEALEIAEYFTATKDKLSEPAYMQIDTSQVDANLKEPVEKMQEFERLSNEEHMVKLTGDKKKLKELEGDMDEIVDYLDGLNKDQKIKLGIEGLDKDEIKEKLENNEIEIPTSATVDVQMEMGDDIKDIAAMAKHELGIITDEELDLEVKYDLDTSLVDSWTPEQHEAVVKYFEDHEEVDNYTPETKEALAKFVADTSLLDGYKPEEKKAIVEYLTDSGDPDSYTPKQKEAVAKFISDTGDPDGWTPETKEAIAKFISDTKDPDEWFPDSKDGVVEFTKDTSKIDGWTPPPKTGSVKYKITGVIGKVGDFIKGIGGANGTANVNGTAFVDGTTSSLSSSKSGKAFKKGDWSTKDSGTALMGELGTETIVRNGRFFTVGEDGAGFYDYKKGDIIFNHKQTEELFKNGKVASGGGRGKTFASGTAFAEGVAFNLTGSSGTGGMGRPNSGSGVSGGGSKKSSPSSKKSSSKSKSSAKEAAKEFEETFDWIEIAIDRIERAIDQLDTKASSVYRVWSERNTNLTSEIGKVNEEISLQQKAYDRYIKQANSVGLSSSYAQKVRDGKIDIETIKDEKLAEKIKDYQTWYRNMPLYLVTGEGIFI